MACSVAATLALVAPVAMHRVLFRQHRLKTLVSAAHRLAYAGLVLLGLALVGVTLVVFDVVYDRGVATVAGAIVLGAFAMLWVMLPLLCAESGKAPRSRRAERIPRMFAYLVGQRCPLHRDPDRGIRLRLRLVGLALSTLELASGTGGGACPPMDHHHGSSRYGRSVVTKEVVSATGVTLRKRT